MTNFKQQHRYAALNTTFKYSQKVTSPHCPVLHAGAELCQTRTSQILLFLKLTIVLLELQKQQKKLTLG